jgi:prepilin-type N-terminal cleavage/methylation domain-containing protein
MYMVKGNHVMKHGFTLYELLVVVAIVAILAALILTQVCKAKESAQYRQMEERSRQGYLTMLSENPETAPISKTLGTCKVNSQGTTWYWGPAEGFHRWRWNEMDPSAFYGDTQSK